MKEDITLLVNLDTGESIEAESSILISRGIPEGYIQIDEITNEQWLKALQKALNES